MAYGDDAALPATVEQLRLAVRVAGSDFDDELTALAMAAVEDMGRAGVPGEFLASGSPLVRHACLCFVKAHFGFDNADADRLADSYRQALCDLLNSPSLTGASR